MAFYGALFLLWGAAEGSLYLLRPGPVAATLLRLAYGLGSAGLILFLSRGRNPVAASVPGSPVVHVSGLAFLAAWMTPRGIAAPQAASTACPGRSTATPPFGGALGSWATSGAWASPTSRTVPSPVGRATGSRSASGRGKPAVPPLGLPTHAIIAGAAFTSVLLGLLLHAASGVSANEFTSLYVAERLAHGTFVSLAGGAPAHAAVQRLPVSDTGFLSFLLPGWPLVLAPFVAAGIGFAANPALVLLSGGFLLAVLRTARVYPPARAATLTLVLLAPFALFNAASLFNHTLAATAILAVVWLDLRDGRHPHGRNRIGIGVAFAVLLATRYEAFALALLLFVADHLLRRRSRFFRWASPAALGLLPGVLLLGLYDWQVAAEPTLSTLRWGLRAAADGLGASGSEGRNSPVRALLHVGRWSLGYADFASVAILPLYAAALWRRLRGRTLRWFDLLLPVVVVFFFFFPDYGGFQHGPRYWFIAHALAPLTVALEGGWRVGRLRVDPWSFAKLQTLAFIGFTLGYGCFAHLQARARLLPITMALHAPGPSAVLFPERAGIRLVPWQHRTQTLYGADLAHRAPHGQGRVWLGLDPGPGPRQALCRELKDRTVFRLLQTADARPPRLVPVCGCPQPAAARSVIANGSISGAAIVKAGCAAGTAR